VLTELRNTILTAIQTYAESNTVRIKGPTLDKMDQVVQIIEQLAAYTSEQQTGNFEQFVEHLSDLCCQVSRQKGNRVTETLERMLGLCNFEIYGTYYVEDAHSSIQHKEQEESSAIEMDSASASEEEHVPSPPK
jgi:hypothetical protein